jgi:hypothetical protein
MSDTDVQQFAPQLDGEIHAYDEILSPAVITRIYALEVQLATLRTEQEAMQRDGPPGLWKCHACGFQLTKAFMRASDGAVGVDRRPVEDICPNDGMSLRPVTWKEACDNAGDMAVLQMERATAAEAQCATLRQALEQIVDERATGLVWAYKLREVAKAALATPPAGQQETPQP